MVHARDWRERRQGTTAGEDTFAVIRVQADPLLIRPAECTPPLPDAVGYCCPAQVVNQCRATQLDDLDLTKSAALTGTGGKLSNSGRVTVVQWTLEVDDLAKCATHAVRVR